MFCKKRFRNMRNELFSYKLLTISNITILYSEFLLQVSTWVEEFHQVGSMHIAYKLASWVCPSRTVIVTILHPNVIIYYKYKKMNKLIH
jgi:hypothetical protein